MKTIWMRQLRPFVSEVKEYIFFEMDLINGILVIQDRLTGEFVTGRLLRNNGESTLLVDGGREFEITEDYDL